MKNYYSNLKYVLKICNFLIFSQILIKLGRFVTLSPYNSPIKDRQFKISKNKRIQRLELSGTPFFGEATAEKSTYGKKQ
jgi:hypothetical protein